MVITNVKIITMSDKDYENGYVRFENGSVVLLVGDTLPDAGTYRLSVEYSFKGVCFAASQHTFFVNYSGHAHAVNWG